MSACWAIFLSASHLGDLIIHTHAHSTHAHHHTLLCTNRPTTTHRSKIASFLRSPESSDSVGDERVTFPLWVYVWEANEKAVGNYRSRWENQRHARMERWPAARAPAALAIWAAARSLVGPLFITAESNKAKRCSLYWAENGILASAFGQTPTENMSGDPNQSINEERGCCCLLSHLLLWPVLPCKTTSTREGIK
jgi:hypothetical protein